jgi:hypothetical protein
MDKTISAVYWMDHSSGKPVAMGEFGFSTMKDMLDFSETIRKEGEATGLITHVATCTTNVNQVGKPGVDVTGKDYDWTKRRSIALRKDTVQ